MTNEFESTPRHIARLCDCIREEAFGLHRYLRHGHLEKVYENGLVHRLQKQGIQVLSQHPLTVQDEDGTPLGNFLADMFVENTLVVELKAVRALADEHVAQLLGYLRASGIEHGLLINFGAPRIEIRKFALSAPASEHDPLLSLLRLFAATPSAPFCC